MSETTGVATLAVAYELGTTYQASAPVVGVREPSEYGGK